MVPVRRDEGERPFWAWKGVGHELGGGRSQEPHPLLLPRPDEEGGRVVVGNGGTGRGEGEPAAAALAAARDGPCGRRPAAGAQRLCERPQRSAAGRAQQSAEAPADGAAAREDEVEQIHRLPRLGAALAQLPHASVPIFLAAIASPSMTSLIIRAETRADQRAIAAVTEAAFGKEREARMVDAIRASDRFVPELS